MNIFLLFFTVLFLHLIADYLLQGILSKLKCKDFWTTDNMPKEYRYDYIPALLAHSFMWAFTMMIPILYSVYNESIIYQIEYIIVLLINTALHAYIDDLKANKRKINLVKDQICHLCQVVMTVGLFSTLVL